MNGDSRSRLNMWLIYGFVSVRVKFSMVPYTLLLLVHTHGMKYTMSLMMCFQNVSMIRKLLVIY